MDKPIRYVGLDVHKETITAAVAEKEGEPYLVGTIPNNPEAVRRLIKRIGEKAELRACYEAGPCGYVLYWQLTQMGVDCQVVAPTLIPVKAGDRVKTDNKDALKLARCHRNGDLTAVWVPDAEHEALRDLVRAREAAKKDQRRARHRLQKMLLRNGKQAPEGCKAWTEKYRDWVATVEFSEEAKEATRLDYVTEVDHAQDRIERLDKALEQAIEKVPESMKKVVEALQTLRGVKILTAATIVAEVGEMSRFESPRELMSYAGMVPSEHSSGNGVHKGGITKTGNAHLRRIVTEAAWAYRCRPRVCGDLKKRQNGQSEEVKAMAWKAQNRLHQKYKRLLDKGKPSQRVVTATGRELLGFVWAIGVHVEGKRPFKMEEIIHTKKLPNKKKNGFSSKEDRSSNDSTKERENGTTDREDRKTPEKADALDTERRRVVKDTEGRIRGSRKEAPVNRTKRTVVTPEEIPAERDPSHRTKAGLAPRGGWSFLILIICGLMSAFGNRALAAQSRADAAALSWQIPQTGSHQVRAVELNGGGATGPRSILARSCAMEEPTVPLLRTPQPIPRHPSLLVRLSALWAGEFTWNRSSGRRPLR